MWQNAVPVDSTGNLEVVLDLKDIESSNVNHDIEASKVNDPAIVSSVPLLLTLNPPTPLEGIKNNISTMEDGVLFMEGDMPPSKGTVGTLNDSKILLTDHYHCDAYTDMEVDILAKCYAGEDHDLSFSKGER